MTRAIGLNFHGIGAPRRELEPGEAPYWLERDRFLRILDQVVAGGEAYEITFDDGNLSDFDIAMPALLERKLTAGFFVPTARINTPGSLSTGNLVAMSRAGMTIGSHGRAHVRWTGLDDAALDIEIRRSREELEQILEGPVTRAGIPFGAYNQTVLRALRHAGYRVCYTSDGGRMNTRSFVRPRTSLRNDMTDAEIGDVLLGHLPAKRRLRRAAAMAAKRFLTGG